MATPTGQIKFSDLNNELGTTGAINLNRTDVRNLAAIPSGEIGMSDLQGKSSTVVIEFTVQVTDRGKTGVAYLYEGNNSTPLKINIDGQPTVCISLFRNAADNHGAIEVGVFDSDRSGKGILKWDRAYVNNILVNEPIFQSVFYREDTAYYTANASVYLVEYTTPLDSYGIPATGGSTLIKLEYDQLNYQPYPT